MIFGAGPDAYFPWAAGGTGFTVLSVGLVLTSRQIINLIRENRRCNRRLGILYRVVVRNGLDIPVEFFDEVAHYAQQPVPDANGRKRHG